MVGKVPFLGEPRQRVHPLEIIEMNKILLLLLLNLRGYFYIHAKEFTSYRTCRAAAPCWCVLCVLLTRAFRTAQALPAGDVGAGQCRTLLPLTLGHTMLWEIKEDDGGRISRYRRKEEEYISQLDGEQHFHLQWKVPSAMTAVSESEVYHWSIIW